MHRTFLFFMATLWVVPTSFAQDFCTNLPKFIEDVGFEESFTQLRGAQIGQEAYSIGDQGVLKTFYAPKMDLIPGVPAKITHTKMEGEFESWNYTIDYSSSMVLEDQRQIAAYWQETIQKCLEKEAGWQFKLQARKFSSDDRMEMWRAHRTMEGYLGLREINILVELLEEFDDNFRPTGRYSVRLTIH